MKAGEPVKQYRALVGLSYPASRKDLSLCKEHKPHARREVSPGEIVNDIPQESVGWLLEDGRIKEVTHGEVRT